MGTVLTVLSKTTRRRPSPRKWPRRGIAAGLTMGTVLSKTIRRRPSPRKWPRRGIAAGPTMGTVLSKTIRRRTLFAGAGAVVLTATSAVVSSVRRREAK
jgi:hypothetical protein